MSPIFDYHLSTVVTVSPRFIPMLIIRYCGYNHNIGFEKTPYNQSKHGEVVYIVDYTPLWETMKERQVTQYHLLQSGIDNKTLDSLKKNKNITLLTLEKLCDIIGCTPNDVVRFTK